MVATHDQFTSQMRSRLETSGMGLGLVRLLQDAKCFEEARTTLCLLETGHESTTTEPAKLLRKPHRASPRRLSFIARSA